MNKDEIAKRIASLDPMSYHVTQEKGTELAFAGEYWDEHDPGFYHCKVCGQRLFSSDHKFDSGTGWPSFDRALSGATKTQVDYSGGMHRTEVICSKCGAHLGHLFDDGPSNTTGQRFCINSCALDLERTKS